MRTANPALNEKTFKNVAVRSGEGTMSIQGTVNKTAILLLFALFTATYTWTQFGAGNLSQVQLLMIVGAIGGFIAALVTIFKKNLAPVSSLIYAALEGLFLGGLSAQLESVFPGIVIQAVSLTFATTFALLVAYKSRLIRATENFKLGIVAATGGIVLVYLLSIIMGFFGTTIPYIHESGTIGIAFSLFVVTIAALNLVLDFDFIETASERGLPKYMEWYGAFGLMVTLVWLYIEILRLLSKLRSNQ